MQPTGIRQGSMGIPEEMRKSMEAKMQSKKPPEPTPTQTPAQVAGFEEEKPAETKSAEDKGPTRAEQLAALKSELEASLDAKITEDDIQDYIFKGKIIKTVSVIPGKFKGTFQTHSPKELSDIDTLMAAYRDAGKQTPKGIANEETVITLGYFWTHFAGKSLGSTPEMRIKNIRQMGGHVVSLAGKAWDDFNALLQVCLNEEQFVKKS